MRQYAAEQLAARRDEEAAARDRHLAWYLALAEDAAPRLRGTADRGRGCRQTEREHDNLRAALRWALAAARAGPPVSSLAHELGGPARPGWADPLTASEACPGGHRPTATTSAARRPRAWPGPYVERRQPAVTAGRERRLAGLRLATALWRFWYTRGYASEGRAWLEAALQPRRGRGSCAARRGAQGRRQPGVPAARLCARPLLLDESLALYARRWRTRRRSADVLANLGLVARSQGDYARARALLEECLALRRGLGDTRGIASSLTNLGLVAQNQGDLPRAAALLDESLA